MLANVGSIDNQALGARIIDLQQRVFNGSIPAGNALTLTEAQHGGSVILLNSATGTTITLSPAIGQGARYRFVVTAVPSGSHKIQVANANDFIIGSVSNTNNGTKAGNHFAAANSGTVATGGRHGTWRRQPEVQEPQTMGHCDHPPSCRAGSGGLGLADSQLLHKLLNTFSTTARRLRRIFEVLVAWQLSWIVGSSSRRGR